jgi:hypothetical protein
MGMAQVNEITLKVGESENLEPDRGIEIALF